MSGFFSKLSKSRHRETGAGPSHPPPASSDTTRPSSPASTSNTNTSLKAPKSGLRQAIRDRFSSNNQTPKGQQQPHPPTVAPESEAPSQNEATPEIPENLPRPLQSKRLDIELPEDAHYQQKVDAIEYSIQAISLFEDLSKVISLVLPDALGQVLGKITEILTLLKKMVENKEAWKQLLISIDDKQRAFNEQLKDVQPRELPPRLLDALRKYAKSLEGLAIRVMEQAGVVENGTPKEPLLARMRSSGKRFLNADSDAEDITSYEKELSAILGEVQAALTIYISIVVTRVDRKADNLKALIFLEGSSSAPERGPLGTKHKKCLENTRIDVLEDIRLWNRADDTDAKPVYCIGDVAGTGKSTIAYTMAIEWSSSQCFNFFFSNTSSHDAGTLCISFAKQIIGCCDGPGWDEYWATLSSELASPASQNFENLWEKLVCDPLGKCTKHRRHILVVDALDECGMETRTRLLKCVLKACTSKSQPQLRLLLTARKENDIRNVLEMKEFRDAIVLRSLQNSKTSRDDVAHYIEHRLNEGDVVGLKPEQRNQLVDRCNGLFIFAFHACNLVKAECPGDQPLVLEEILAEFTSLDSLYLRTLTQVGSSSRIQARLMNILRVILVAREPLSISTITAMLSENVQNVTEIVKKLGSILGSSGVDDPVYILHATFNEFLLRKTLTEEKPDLETSAVKEKQNQYYINKADGERALVKGCLSNVMAKELKFNICHLETSCLLNEEVTDMDDRISKHISKSLRYSCLHWASHLESATLDADTLDHLKHFINNLYLAWLEVLSVTKRVGLAPKMLSTLIECMEKNKQGNDKARDMYRFATTFASVIAQSAPHVYLSALPFAPQQSALSRCYVKLFPGILGVKSGGFDNWPPAQNVLFGHASTVASVSFSLDGKRIVSGSWDETVRVWDAETGQAVGAPFQGHSRDVSSVAFSPDGKRIVSGSEDNTVRVWDAETGQAVGAPFQGHSDLVTSVAFSPDGKRIVSGSSDKTVRVWDAETGQAVGAPFQGHSNSVTSVAFSPDGKRIVSGSRDKTVRVWDAETGQAVGAPFQGHSNWVTSVAFSPDGKHIVSGSYDKTVRVWDAETGQAVGAPFQGHSNSVTSVAFSPDGKRIVSGSSDNTVRVWDAETSQAVGAPFQGHSNFVTSVASSPDGKRIVSGSRDNTVRVWDAETGQAVGAPFQGHNDWVRSVAFSPDSKRIVSGSEDKTVQTWDHKNVERDHVSLSVKSETGWILDSRSERLFWVPPHILPGLVTGGAFFIIAPFLTTTVDLSNFVYGESWVQCKERTETED